MAFRDNMTYEEAKTLLLSGHWKIVDIRMFVIPMICAILTQLIKDSDNGKRQS